MSRIDILLTNYRRLCGMPWDPNTAGPQRVWLAVYEKEDERKLRARLGGFEEATRAGGHGWHTADLTDTFARWVTTSAHRSFAASFFAQPSRLGAGQMSALRQWVAGQLRDALAALPGADNTVLAVTGAGALFGFVQMSDVLPLVDPHVLGRLLVFFPGSYSPNNYRLFDARDGWNYLATPILAGDPEPRG